MSVLSEIRRLPGVLQTLSDTLVRVVKGLDELIDLQQQNGPALERIQELERTRAHWEAEMEAQLLRADSTLKSASNAESRSRTMVRHAEKLADPFDSEVEEEQATLPAGYAPGGETERLQPLHLELAPNKKAYALRAKFL